MPTWKAWEEVSLAKCAAQHKKWHRHVSVMFGIESGLPVKVHYFHHLAMIPQRYTKVQKMTFLADNRRQSGAWLELSTHHCGHQIDGWLPTDCVLLPEPRQVTAVDWRSWMSENDVAAATAHCQRLNNKHTIQHTPMKEGAAAYETLWANCDWVTCYISWNLVNCCRMARKSHLKKHALDEWL